MQKPGPVSTLICLAAVIFTLLSGLVFLPAAELLPAQVFPAKRNSGESLVQSLPGASAAMNFYAGAGVQILKLLRKLPASRSARQPGNETPATSSGSVVSDWQSQLVLDNGKKYGTSLAGSIAARLGGDDNLKAVLYLLHLDGNFVYNAYALFLALALFATSVAIQAMGRWGAEEKTILPVKK